MQQAYSRLPHLKITELLLEVDDWTGFTRHFKHLKSGAAAEDRHLLLTARKRLPVNTARLMLLP